MASLDQMEGDAIEFVLLVAVVLIVAALILAAKGSVGLLNWLKSLLARITGALKNSVPGQVFMGAGKGGVQSGNSSVTNVTDDQAYNSAYMGGTLLGSYLSATVPIVTDYGGSDPGSGVGVVSIEGEQ